MHITPSAQSVDATEVVTVSTDAQPSSSQQGINLFLKGHRNRKKKSFVAEVVAVDFAVAPADWQAWTSQTVRSFPLISTRKRR
jgi:hypothetical protein